MRKGIKLSVVAALSLGLLAGCGGGSKSKTASSSDEIKVWVQFSDETAEGKAWQQVVDNFNIFHVVVAVEDMKIRSMLLLRQIVYQMLLR